MGVALTAAYWILALLFMFLSIAILLLLAGRTKSMQPSARNLAPVVIGLIPTSLSVAAAAEFQVGWSLLFSVAAIVFGLWVLRNIASRGE